MNLTFRMLSNIHCMFVADRAYELNIKFNLNAQSNDVYLLWVCYIFYLWYDKKKQIKRELTGKNIPMWFENYLKIKIIILVHSIHQENFTWTLLCVTTLWFSSWAQSQAAFSSVCWPRIVAVTNEGLSSSATWSTTPKPVVPLRVTAVNWRRRRGPKKKLPSMPIIPY